MIGRHTGNHPRGTWMSESFVLVRLGERPALGFHGRYTVHKHTFVLALELSGSPLSRK